MSDAKLWIDEVGCTAMITRPNVSYTMPLWVFEDMREIIVAEAEKKVEVTHRDFDIQQELLDRYRAENAKLRKLLLHMQTCMEHLEYPEFDCSKCPMDNSTGNCDFERRMKELGVEVDE